jgi:hypothetical protein
MEDANANKGICNLAGKITSISSKGRFIITKRGCRKFHEISLLRDSFGLPVPMKNQLSYPINSFLTEKSALKAYNKEKEENHIKDNTNTFLSVLFCGKKI